MPELADVDDAVVHAPWRDPRVLAETGYPPPLVDHREARERFLHLRGRPGTPGH